MGQGCECGSGEGGDGEECFEEKVAYLIGVMEHRRWQWWC